MTQQLYRNWSAICAIENPALRIAAATLEDAATLEKLRLGFPELFCEEEQRALPRVPLSALKYAMDGIDPNGDALWRVVFKKFGIPILWLSNKEGSERDGPIPENIVRTVQEEQWCNFHRAFVPHEQKKGPVYVDYLGQKAIIIDEALGYGARKGWVEIVMASTIDFEA